MINIKSSELLKYKQIIFLRTRGLVTFITVHLVGCFSNNENINHHENVMYG